MKTWCLIFLWLFSSMVMAGKTWQPLETTPPPKKVVEALKNSIGTPYKMVTVLKNNQMTVTAEAGGNVRVTREGLPDRVIPNPRPITRNPSVFNAIQWNQISAMTFSPDGKLLFVGSAGGGLRVLNLESLKEVGLFRDKAVAAPKAHGGGVKFLWIIPRNPSQPNDYWLVSASRDCTIKIWEVGKIEPIAKVVMSSHVDHFWQLSNDTITIAAATQILEIRPNRLQKFLWLSQHRYPVRALNFVDGQLWSRASDNTYIGWNLERGKSQNLHTNIEAAALTPDQKLIVLIFGTNQIQIRKNGKRWHEVKHPIANRYDPDILEQRLLVSKNGRYVALVNVIKVRMIMETNIYTRFTRIWDLSTSSPQEVPIPEYQNPASGQDYDNAIKQLTGFEKNPSRQVQNKSLLFRSQVQTVNGKPMFIGVEKKLTSLQIGLYKAQNQTLVRDLGVIDSNWDSTREPLLSFSPDGSRAAAIHTDHLFLWDTNQGRQLNMLQNQEFAQVTLPRQYPSKSTLVFLSDSEHLLLWNVDKRFGTVWDSQKLQKVSSFTCKRELVTFLAREVICNNTNRLDWLPIR